MKYTLTFRSISITIRVLIVISVSLLFSCENKKGQVIYDGAKADSIITKVNYLLNAGHVDSSVKYLNLAYKDFQEAAPLDQWKRYSFLKNFYLNYQVLPDKADAYTDSMFLVLDGLEEQFESEHASNLFSRGDVLRAKNRFNEAFYQYYIGREFASTHLNSCELAVFTNRLGLVRYEQQDYLNAITYFKQALDENRGCQIQSTFENRFHLRQSIYNNIAFSYELAGMLDSAFQFYDLGLNFVEENLKLYPERRSYIESAIGVFSGNLGGLYVKLNQLDKAEMYLRQSIQLNDREGFARDDAITAKIKLSDMYIRQGRLNDADSLISQVEESLKNIQGSDMGKQASWRKIIKVKSELLQRKGDYKNALNFLNLYVNKGDSLNALNKNNRLNDMEVAFSEAEKTQKLELVRKHSQLQSYLLAAGLIILFLIVGIMVILWKHLGRSKRGIEQLSRLNKKIAKKNEHLHQALTVLELSHQENARMARVVAHDLKNPISAVYLATSLLLDKRKNGNNDVQLIEVIRKSTKSCLSMVDDLLKPSVLDVETNRQPEDLYQILSFCIEQMEAKANEKRQILTLSGESLSVSLDSEKIWRVINNLVINAIKFSPEGGHIDVSLKKDTDKVTIAVKDWGIGIPDDLKDKIFNSPQDAKRKGTAGEETYGLGLMISKQIVDAHHGKIWFESGIGTGTVFFVELPLDHS